MRTIVAQPTNNLQDCLNLINASGGGILELNPTATFYPKGDLIIYSDTVINGNCATIDFGGKAYGFKTPLDGSLVNNSSLSNLTIQNSSVAGVDFYNTNNDFGYLINNIIVSNCAIGINLDTCVGPYIFGVINDNGTNCIMTDCSSIEIHFSNFYNSTDGDGLVLNNCEGTVIDVGFLDNVGNGITITNSNNLTLISTISGGNTLDGVYLSGNTNIQFNSFSTDSNIKNGVNLHDANANVAFSTCVHENNGLYGINIADDTTTNTIVSTSIFSSNTSGALNNHGTDIIIRSNQGVADN